MKGWRGNSDGHRKVGRLGGSKTASTHGTEFYQKIGSMGGSVSPGNFRNNPERAAEAGRKGGRARKPMSF